MDYLVLILLIIIAVISYLFICDCILRRKENFLNNKGYLLDRSGIEDIQTGGYFGKWESSRDTLIPLRAISSEQKSRIKNIVKPILKKINKQMKLQFEATEVESIYKRVENNGNIRLKLDVFTFEKLNHYNRRLLLDLTLDYSVNKIIVNQINIANAKKPKNPENHREFYFNDSILSEDNKNSDQDIYGHSDSQLAFDKLDYINEHINEKNFKEWILPKAYLEKINGSLPVWPCRAEEFKWDTYGINQTEKGKDGCQGINSSYSKKQYIPKFDPSLRQVNKEGRYDWIFGNFSKGTGNTGTHMMY